ncbi:MAG: alcohol dehydrogenase catalytic domain-containing protein [Anaerofustis sp.]
MKAYRLVNQQQLAYQELPMPEPQSGELLIQIAHCGICRTDRKCYAMGQRDLHMPRILGHEITGKVYALGSDVTGYQLGQRVVLHPGVSCGTCEFCRSDRDQLCHEMQIFGFHLDGGFAEYCLVPAQGVKNHIVIPIPDSLDFKTAALAEPLACAVNMKEKMPNQIKHLVIFGGGALGTLTALLWIETESSDVTVVEPNQWKRDVLSGLHIRSVSSVEDLTEAVDAVINCCPDPSVFEAALNLLIPGGILGYFSGLTGADGIPQKTINQIHYKELCIVGAYGCALHHTQQAVKYLTQGLADAVAKSSISLSELPVHIASLEQDQAIFTAINLL